MNYPEYLKVNELLTLQQPKSKEHDEMLFILIHQTYELWFKQVLHELDFLKISLVQGNIPKSLHTLKRTLTILKTLVGQVDILETMTPLEFKSFRNRLDTASGFESAQFREIEFVLGYKRENLIHIHDEISKQKLKARLETPSIWSDFLSLVATENYTINPQWQSDPHYQDDQLEALLIEIYQHNFPLSQICELLVDLDEGLQEWRYRHVKMVQRTIGTKMGTGGSSGAEYLTKTLFKPLFPSLWNIRAKL
ncbi:tryptophan 2,3-dioxygenase family protein [uncultured Shewanella sp.]|uniref:tryptophan 2,3-dioxygenase n=1 Tax=uncultured Shewanella sp. TaxID=173975 RepID=UPI00262CC280|nr:tryptophan 2,3-dioxygenase family protein [uncultured Shewanella sp.]